MFQGFFLMDSDMIHSNVLNWGLLLLLMSNIVNWDFFSAKSSLKNVFKTETKLCLLARTWTKTLRIPSLNFSQTVSDLGFKWGNMKYFQTLTVAINRAQSLLLIDLSNGWIPECLLTDIGVFPKWNRNSMNSANSGNLINHWSINWSQFKGTVSHICFAGTVVASWSLMQKVTGLNPSTVMTNSVKTFRENSNVLYSSS